MTEQNREQAKFIHPLTHGEFPIISLAGETFYVLSTKLTDIREQAKRYVIATWVNSARKAVRTKHHLSAAEYNEMYPALVENIFADDGHDISLLTMDVESTVFHGWLAVSHSGHILYAYTPPELRRFGLFKAMCEENQWLNSRKNQQLNLACLFPYPMRTPHQSASHLPAMVKAALGSSSR